MVKTASTMLSLGAEAPDFSLPNVDGRTVSLGDFADSPALVVIFMCNHCPFVMHISPALARFGDECQRKGVAMVGINSNDRKLYPDDAPEKMVEEAARRGYHFPYHFDESQDVAKHQPPARRTSIYSTGREGWCTAASSTPAVPTRASPSPERTCVLPWTPCWHGDRSRRTSGRASAAISSGSPATSRATERPRRAAAAAAALRSPSARRNGIGRRLCR